MCGHNAGLVKAIGEPYEGKPHVRFDGGAVEPTKCGLHCSTLLWDGYFTDANNDGDTDDAYEKTGEKTWGTDPKDDDYDDDGLKDGYDEVFGPNGWFSNPYTFDTDDDGLWDGDMSDWNGDGDTNDRYEDKGERNLGTDPTSPHSDATQQYPQGDGLNDGIEHFVVFTDPKNLDSDNDGINDYYDLEPWGNLKIVFMIQEIVLIASFVDDGSEADFIGITWVDSVILQGGSSSYYTEFTSQDDYIRAYTTYIFDIVDNTRSVPIRMRLQDDDGSGKVDELDISNSGDISDNILNILFATWTGYWHGDDYTDFALDQNGYGFSTGYGDGNNKKDAAVWFDVYTKADNIQNPGNPIQTPYGVLDNDGLSQYAEARWYGSDPFEVDTDNDGQMPDNNGINDRLEVLYGLDPTEPSENYNYDLVDFDGIDLGAEARFGGRPNQQDIFVEVDWMQDDNHNFYIGDTVMGLLVKAFARQNIFIHIDDGFWSGGNSVPYFGTIFVFQKDDYYEDFYDFKNQYMYQQNQRLGYWHYALLGDQFIPEVLRGGKALLPGADLFISMGLLLDTGQYKRTIASTIMHELGHNLGLRHFGDMNTPNNHPSYKSVMSYYYVSHPDRWPRSWQNIPQYGSKTGWNDWDNLNFAGVNIITT